MLSFCLLFSTLISCHVQCLVLYCTNLSSFLNKSVTVHSQYLIEFRHLIQCSVSCEQGIKQRNVQCVDINNVTVDESKCRHNPKPSTTKPCSAGSCNTNWYASQKWSHVSAIHFVASLIGYHK